MRTWTEALRRGASESRWMHKKYTHASVLEIHSKDEVNGEGGVQEVLLSAEKTLEHSTTDQQAFFCQLQGTATTHETVKYPEELFINV